MSAITCPPSTASSVELEEFSIVVSVGPFHSVEEAASAAERVDWYDDNMSDDDACTEAYAALELRDFLARLMDRPPASIRFRTRPGLPGIGTVFVLGSRASNESIARLFRADSLPGRWGSPEAYHLRATRAGPRRVVGVEGASRVGTLYGVYALLELLGVRFYGLGENGTIAPGGLVGIPDSLDREESPAFDVRGFWAWEPRGNEEFFIWMARNRINYWTAAEPRAGRLAQLGIHRVAGGHDVQKLLLDPEESYPYRTARSGDLTRPPDPFSASLEGGVDRDADGRVTRFEAHPEWYAMIDGYRDPDIGMESGHNFCTSNADAVTAFCDALVRRAAAGDWRNADIVALWMLDNGRWCECASCVAVGTPTDRMLRLFAAVKDAIRAARAGGILNRNVTVTMPAFLETSLPPRAPGPESLADGDAAITWFPIYRCYAHALADPSCREINEQQSRLFRAWATDPDRRYRGPVEVGEYYGIAECRLLPMVSTRVIAADIPWYQAHGVRGFHYMHVPTRIWGPWTLTHALLTRLLWNPARSPERIEAEFFIRYYPSTADSVRLAYRKLEHALANLKLLMHRVQVGPHVFDLRIQLRGGGDAYALRHLQRTTRHPMTDDAPDMDEMEQASGEACRLLEHAETCSNEPRERRRLAEDLARARHARATIEFFATLLDISGWDAQGQREQARAAWPRLERAMDALRSMTDVVRGSASHAESRDAFEATRMSAEVERLRERIRSSEP